MEASELLNSSPQGKQQQPIPPAASSTSTSSGALSTTTHEQASASDMVPSRHLPFPANYDPEHWTLISQGAEARVWKVSERGPPSQPPPPQQQQQGPRNSHGLSSNDDSSVFVIIKERFAKRYRHPILDERLTKQRCRAEARILQKCVTAAVPVPLVLKVDPPILTLQYVTGSTVRNVLHQELEQLVRWTDQQDATPPDGDHVSEAGDDRIANSVHTTDGGVMANGMNINSAVPEHPYQVHLQRVLGIARQIGYSVGQLHALVHVVHGDLTTSNMILHPTTTQLPQPDIASKQRTDTPTSDPNVDDGAIDNRDSNIDHHFYGTLILIDFGLAKHSESSEERAVDLYVLERAIASTHATGLPNNFVDVLLQAYANSLDRGLAAVAATAVGAASTKKSQQPAKDDCKAVIDGKPSSSSIAFASLAVLARLEQVRQRGRKRECFG